MGSCLWAALRTRGFQLVCSCSCLAPEFPCSKTYFLLPARLIVKSGHLTRGRHAWLFRVEGMKSYTKIYSKRNYYGNPLMSHGRLWHGPRWSERDSFSYPLFPQPDMEKSTLLSTLSIKVRQFILFCWSKASNGVQSISILSRAMMCLEEYYFLSLHSRPIRVLVSWWLIILRIISSKKSKNTPHHVTDQRRTEDKHKSSLS